MLKQNHYSEDILLKAFEYAYIEHGALVIPVYSYTRIDDYDNIEVWFEDIEDRAFTEDDLNKRKNIIQEILKVIPILDDAVQDSLEKDYYRCNGRILYTIPDTNTQYIYNINDFLYTLAYITISTDSEKVYLHYWGDKKNSEFVECFVRQGSDWVKC